MQTHASRFVPSWAIYVFLLALTLANSGCLLIAAGAAGGAAVGYAYANGRVYETYNANFGDAWAATQTSLRELGMPIVKEERNADGGFLESRTADNETVRIYVDALPSKIPAEGSLSRVSVRVATFGDKPMNWDEVLRGLTIRLPIVIPLVWLAIYAGRNYMLSLRLEEDYAYKESISVAFEGYKREMTQIGTGDAANPSPLMTLCVNVLKAISERPGRIYDGKQQDIRYFFQNDLRY